MRIFTFLLSPFFLLVVTGQLITERTAVAGNQQALRPALLYHNYCSVCHGDHGDGKSHAETSMSPPPKNFTLPAVAKSLTRERMITAVRDGLPGTAMAGWKSQLSEKEIEAVVDYIREIFMPPVGTGDINPGKKIYAHTCSVCHGDDGKSARWGSNLLSKRPRNFTTEASRRELTRERMINSVTHGVPNTPMAGFGTQLSKKEIEQVVDYIRNAFMQTAELSGLSGTHAHGKITPETNQTKESEFSKMGVIRRNLLPDSEKNMPDKLVDMTAPLPNNLRGDATRGKAAYLQNCAECHGAKGDGEGPRAYFIFPRPRNFNRESSRRRFNRPALFHSISKGKLGTEMPAWELVLKPQEIADLSEYVFQAFIKGKSGQGKSKAKAP